MNRTAQRRLDRYTTAVYAGASELRGGLKTEVQEVGSRARSSLARADDPAAGPSGRAVLRILPQRSTVSAVAVVVLGIGIATGIWHAWQGLVLTGPPISASAVSEGPGAGRGAQMGVGHGSAPPKSIGPGAADGVDGSGNPGGAPGPPQLLAPGTGGREILIHVVGAVAKPGLVRLSAGSRVNDALQAAGGPLEHANLAALNLALELSDGQQIRVAGLGEELADPAASGAGGLADLSPAAPINLNTASFAQLQELPGVGPAIAQRIIDFRTQYGRLGSVEQLQEISGIGPALLKKIAGKVRV